MITKFERDCTGVVGVTLKLSESEYVLVYTVLCEIAEARLCDADKRLAKRMLSLGDVSDYEGEEMADDHPERGA